MNNEVDKIHLKSKIVNRCSMFNRIQEIEI